MKLIEAHVSKFRNFADSGNVLIESDVTALVGKNESGKTAFLQALYHLKPIHKDKLDALDQYPRWLYTQDRKASRISDTAAITAVFELEEEDFDVLADRFGEGVVTATRVTASRTYENFTSIDQESEPDEAKAVSWVVRNADIAEVVREGLEVQETFDALEDALEQIARTTTQGEAVSHENVTAAANIRSAVSDLMGDYSDLDEVIEAAIWERVPHFFYFGEYSFLAGRTDLKRVFVEAEENLEPGERTALALLRLAGADNMTLVEEDYERRKAELEAVSNDLTRQTAKYWTQSKELDVVIDIDKETVPTANNGQQAVNRFLEVRVKDRRHGHSDNIDKRSHGFRWFFSFLAAFSEFEGKERIIILLDEPAVALHARAQRDFLRFIDDRLAPEHQVIFTTHSPFMVEPGKLDRARLVEDQGSTLGSKVTADVMSTNRDTLFPLQAALGYDIAQSLFIAPHNLLVEGTSDYTYLHAMSDFLRQNGRVGLDPRWCVLPVGSVTKITTFLALLGHHLDVSVLVDSGGENKQVAELVRNGRLEPSRFLTPAEILGTSEADIEDLFTVTDYLDLYHLARSSLAIDKAELGPGIRIIKRIEAMHGKFDHGQPADYILRNRTSILDSLEPTTLNNFESLFIRINAVLPSD